MKKKQYSFLLSVIFGLMITSTCSAASILSESLSDKISDQAGSSGLNATEAFNEEISLTEIVAQVIKSFLGILGIIFVVLMILGGYNWMTAQGDESKVEKAKSTIQKAVIGLIIIVASYSITYTLFKAINF